MVLTARPKIIIRDVILQEKNGRMLATMEFDPPYFYELVETCQKYKVELEPILKELLNNALNNYILFSNIKSKEKED